MKLIKSSFYFFSAFLGMAVLFEIILRVGGVMTPVLTIDPDDGERYLPNKMVCSLFNYEGFGLAKTNSVGWFGRDPEIITTQETAIGIFGNSYIAARQVFPRHNFLNLSESKLQGQNIHLYNFGKETMPLRESLYIKEEMSKKYALDCFVVFINERSLGNEGRYIPFYELNNDTLKLNSDFKNVSFVKRYKSISLLTQSSLIFLAYRVKNLLPDFWSIALDKLYTSTIEEESDDINTFDRDIDDVDQAVIKEFDKDKRVIFLLDLTPDKAQQICSYIMHAPVINIRPALMQMQQETGMNPYAWPITNQIGHWNYEAHRWIAREFSSQIENIVLKSKKE